jgi:hypothetical protein
VENPARLYDFQSAVREGGIAEAVNRPLG